MFRYALRRVLWAIPTLFGISLFVFLLTTIVSDPTVRARQAAPGPAGAGDPNDELSREDERRALFLDLPPFFNAQPVDVRVRVERVIAALVHGQAAEREVAAARLARLGGAALPYVLPELDALAPESRGRVALALVPIAVRAGLAKPDDLSAPDRALRFWTRFWEDRALDFTGPAVRRAVERFVEYGTELRERDLRVVDTYALDEIFAAMGRSNDPVALARLTKLAAHMTGRGTALSLDADEGERRRVLADWREWWYVHRVDFVALVGAERVAATLGETRYGKWLVRAATGRFGLSLQDGEPVRDKLLRRAPVTLLLTLVAMFASYAIAIPVGAFAAWRRGQPVDAALAVVLFVAYSFPTFWAAQLLEDAFEGVHAGEGWRFPLAVLALTVGSLATLSRYQRSAVLDVVRQDYVRTARAKGVSTARELVVHVLRNALLPTVTLAGLQLPALLGGAFVVEEVFGLEGLGFETVRAAQARDIPWLVATVLVAAVFTTGGLLASDVTYGLLDPRVREALLAKGRGRA